MVDTHAITKNHIEGSHVPFGQVPPMVLSYKATTQYHNEDTDINTIKKECFRHYKSPSRYSFKATPLLPEPTPCLISHLWELLIYSPLICFLNFVISRVLCKWNPLYNTL